MELRIELWQLVSLAFAIGGAFAGIGKLLLMQTQRHIEDRLRAIEETARQEGAQWQRVEREFLQFQAEMPMKYVMRDDYIRGQSIIEAKLDGLADKIEKAQLRSLIHGKGS